MTTAISALFVFFLVVIFHEFGHFIVAKLVGIRVNEFAIGMGPRLLGFKKGETDYSIRALPLGGYVKMEGEDEKSDDERSFNNKSVFARMAVILAGPIMNFVLAIIVYSLISFIVGVPTTIVEDANIDMPAYKAGIRPGDKIVSINEERIINWDQLINEISQTKEDVIKITVERNNKKIDFTVKPTINREDNRKIIGISPKIEKSLLYSIRSGFEKTFYFLYMMLQFFGLLISGKVGTDGLTGPVGIIHLVGEAAKIGFISVLSLAGFISINLGFFNLLPIPALDGSRFIFLTIELFRGKPIDPEKEGFVHFVGFVFLMLLMIVILYKDLIRFNVL